MAHQPTAVPITAAAISATDAALSTPLGMLAVSFEYHPHDDDPAWRDLLTVSTYQAGISHNLPADQQKPYSTIARAVTIDGLDWQLLALAHRDPTTGRWQPTTHRRWPGLEHEPTRRSAPAATCQRARSLLWPLVSGWAAGPQARGMWLAARRHALDDALQGALHMRDHYTKQARAAARQLDQAAASLTRLQQLQQELHELDAEGADA